MSEPAFAPMALAACTLATRHLGWRPDEFWRATPAELATALGPPTDNASPIDRYTLTRLMEQDHG